MKVIPTVMKYMTTTPHAIEADLPVIQAQELMKKHQIRHLPVMSQGKVKGILSDRDLNLALSLRGGNQETLLAQDICTDEVFLTRPDTRLDEVVHLMAEKKIGSVLVVDHSHLVGIFTTTDALRAFGDLLETRFHP